ncbi:hypothetical protein [uncultured Pseudoramibacter sp.]|uniref:hypothetical protein n=1 Tax=uncultured Pseudoramibacter sp. TaxID=1623493 RepID=UPI0025D75D5E|nr:hypothetical protein [uncultured Pseudoramibacter sp.]
MNQPKSILIKDTTREERERIVAQALSVCGGSCNFCSGCGSLGSGRLEAMYEPYFAGEKEIAEINMAIRGGTVKG